MSRRADPTWIGAFVVGAALLSVGGGIAFGGLDLFTDKVSYIAYFERSLAGLDVGAPVRYRGVLVGRVSEIYAVFDPQALSLRTPVVMDFQIGSVRFRGEEGASRATGGEEDVRAELQRLIERGLRAEVRQDSIVTGKLSIAIDFFPDEPARYLDEGHSDLPEFPTRETGLDRLFKSIEQLPIDEVVDDLKRTVVAIEALASDPRLGSALDGLSRTLQAAGPELEAITTAALATLEDLRALIRNVDAQVEPVSVGVQGAIEDLRAFLGALETRSQELASDIGATLGAARDTLEPLEHGLGDDYRLPQRVATLIEELTQAARHVARLVDYLERHPEALIKGKQ